MLSFSIVCLSVAAIFAIIDHYDRRDNEGWYKQLRSCALIASGILFSLGILMNAIDLGSKNFDGLLRNTPAVALSLDKWIPPVPGTIKVFAGIAAVLGILLLLFNYFATRGKRRPSRVGIFGLGALLMAASVFAFDHAYRVAHTKTTKSLVLDGKLRLISAYAQADMFSAFVAHLLTWSAFLGVCGAYLIYRALTSSDGDPFR